MAAPIPPAPPVITAVLPESLAMFSALFDVKHPAQGMFRAPPWKEVIPCVQTPPFITFSLKFRKTSIC
jgi:hypothetical protein